MQMVPPSSISSPAETSTFQTFATISASTSSDTGCLLVRAPVGRILQGQQGTSIGRAGDRATAQLYRLCGGSDQVPIARCHLSRGQVEVVFQANAHVATE